MQPTSSTPLTPPQSDGVAPPAIHTPELDETEKRKRILRYSSPEFTHQLGYHIRDAVKPATREAEEQREK